MCMTVLHRQMYVQHMWVILPNECTYTTCVPGSHGCQQRESDLWELALWMVMSYHLSVVNYTQVLWKNKCSQMLSHLVTFQSHRGNNYTIEICYNKNSGTCHSRESAKRWRIDSENVNYGGLGGGCIFG